MKLVGNLKIGKLRSFCHYKENGLLWFRIFGSGLEVKNVRKRPLLFSERNKITRHLRLRDWLIKVI